MHTVYVIRFVYKCLRWVYTMIDTLDTPKSEEVIPLANYLSRQKIFDRYRQTTGALARTHWQVIYLKSQGKIVRDIVEVTGYSEDFVRQIILRYNEAGADDFIDDKGFPDQAKSDYIRKSSELDTARQAQQEMLATRIPAHPELEIDAFLKTATELSGDYYDFSLSDDGVLTMAIGDATGHGTTAGMMVIATKALFKDSADDSDLLGLIRRMSKTIKSVNLRSTYMHITLARYHQGVLQLVGAGMPPLLMYRSETQTVEDVVLKGMPLGSYTDFPYEQLEIPLNPGDTVFFMSDGILDLQSPCGEMLQLDRVRKIFAEAGTRSPSEIIAHIRKGGIAWRAGRPLKDDVTLLVLQRLAADG